MIRFINGQVMLLEVLLEVDWGYTYLNYYLAADMTKDVVEHIYTRVTSFDKHPMNKEMFIQAAMEIIESQKSKYKELFYRQLEDSASTKELSEHYKTKFKNL